MPRRPTKIPSKLDKHIIFRNKETNSGVINYVYNADFLERIGIQDTSAPNPLTFVAPHLVDSTVTCRNEAMQITRFYFLHRDGHYDRIDFTDTIPELALKLLMHFVDMGRSWKLDDDPWFDGSTQRQRSKMLQSLCCTGLMTKKGRTSNSHFVTTPAGILLLTTYMDAQPPIWAGLPHRRAFET